MTESVEGRPRHILITGASQGIGRALARLYARPATHLSLFGRSVERLEEVAAACRSQGATVCLSIVDVTDAPGMAHAIGEALKRAPIDILIANAGIGGAQAMAGPSGEAPAATYALVNVNFIGVVNTVTPALEPMTARKRGQIVIVSSLAGHIPMPSSPAYSASKAAVRTYGIALDRLVRQSGVRICVVSPGFVETAMSESLSMKLPHLVPVEKAAQIIAEGVAKGRREIIFPWQMALIARVLALLPDRLLVHVLARSQARLKS